MPVCYLQYIVHKRSQKNTKGNTNSRVRTYSRTRDSILLFSFLLFLRLVPLLPRESFTPPPYNATMYIPFIISLSLSLTLSRYCTVSHSLLFFLLLTDGGLHLHHLLSTRVEFFNLVGRFEAGDTLYTVVLSTTMFGCSVLPRSVVESLHDQLRQWP